jgi:hypothetical protein
MQLHHRERPQHLNRGERPLRQISEAKDSDRRIAKECLRKTDGSTCPEVAHPEFHERIIKPVDRRTAWNRTKEKGVTC